MRNGSFFFLLVVGFANCLFLCKFPLCFSSQYQFIIVAK